MLEARAKILLVEDDARLGELTRDYLVMNGHAVDIEPRGDAAPARILTGDYDLVVLDLMLPGMDGLEVCRRVRDGFSGAILMLTARAEEVDEIVGLEVGADDYLPKPVRPRLLLAHVDALLRRLAGRASRARNVEATLRVGPLAIDRGARRVTHDGVEIEVTTAEFDLLWTLASRAGEVVTREDLYASLRGIAYDGLDRSIDLRVARLRKKLGDEGKQPRLLKSVRGAGYLLSDKP
ncbi:MAG: response regulator transcription factor [Deltaproteobacteria bacterium]|nr:response regulator transcription factor [Deltaproteobacteria bacterium]